MSEIDLELYRLP